MTTENQPEKKAFKKAVPKKEAAPAAGKAGRKDKIKQKDDAAGKIAIILVRGVVSVKKDIIATINNFALRQKLACVVVPNNETNKYAAMKCKDYVAYGEISEETYKLLVEKRGEKDAFGFQKKVFRLHPPRGGFERKGIKKPFSLGGALGYRGEKMNDLIQKML
ncbi:uL30 family ribosomal protein [Candidatus Woesearchaeota archaeon]|nr:uL30 family ribosomal protein [Candidatus Woesearchaeota archaeon]